ncbi:MAG: hypothetical protein AAGC85_27010 [Bacteroidota bacterium]
MKTVVIKTQHFVKVAMAVSMLLLSISAFIWTISPVSATPAQEVEVIGYSKYEFQTVASPDGAYLVIFDKEEGNLETLAFAWPEGYKDLSKEY